MSWPFGGTKDSIVALVDIHSSSISAGYAILTPGAEPHIIASVEYPLDEHATEPKSDAVPRVLSLALSALVRTGAPKLMEHAGRARVDRVALSVSGPWQTYKVTMVEKHGDKPFAITEGLVSELLAPAQTPQRGRETTAQSIIASFLNGYETPQPYGMRASSLQVVALTSTINRTFHTLVKEKVKAAFHTKHITTTSFAPELFFEYKALFPHQRDYILLDVGSDFSDTISVKHALLVASGTHALGANDALEKLRKVAVTGGAPAKDLEPVADKETISVLVEKIHAALARLAEEEPLPHLVLYTAPDRVAPFIEDALADGSLCTLWISREQVAVHRLTLQDFAGAVSLAPDAMPSLPLCVLALTAVRHA